MRIRITNASRIVLHDEAINVDGQEVEVEFDCFIPIRESYSSFIAKHSLEDNHFSRAIFEKLIEDLNRLTLWEQCIHGG